MHTPRQEKILIVSWELFGDTLMCTPALRALRKGRPDAHLAFSCHKQWAPLFQDPSQVDEVLPVDRRAWKGVGGWFKRIRDLNALAKRGWDLVLLCGGGGDVRRLVRRLHPHDLAGIYPIPGRQISLPPREVEHHSDRCLEAARLLGGIGSERAYQVASRLQKEATTPLARPPRIAINPGSGDPKKCWPVERFQAVARHLRTQYDAEILILWGPGEKALGEQIAGDDAELAPPTTPEELAQLLASMDLTITGDSGPMHLAAAVGCPIVALFSTADPKDYLPPGDVTLVRHPGRIDQGGMSVAAVTAAVDEAFARFLCGVPANWGLFRTELTAH